MHIGRIRSMVLENRQGNNDSSVTVASLVLGFSLGFLS